MCERAAELGHSLLFPAICRYCKAAIYLFATPEGGFAIFDDVGGDWPKHECWGVDQSTTRYSDVAPTYSRTLSFPVPQSIPIAVPAVGSRLLGTIVAHTSSTHVGLWDSALFDGRSLNQIATGQADLLGRCVRGIVELRRGIPFLTFLETLSPERLRPTPARTEAPSPTEVKSLLPTAIWSLQEHAHAIEKTHPTAAATLSKALDAFLNGYTLAGMLLLTRILTSHADQVAARVKASALRMILLAIRDLGLHAVLPAIESRLSGRTLSVMDKNTRELLDAVRQLGALHRRFVTTERIRVPFERRLKRERRYLQNSQPDSDIGPDFDALWQT